MTVFSLDDAGDEAVAAWLANYPDGEAVARVVDLLDDVSAGRALSPKWHVTRDLHVESDRLIEVRPGLIVVVRLYSDEDPVHMYSVVRIVEVGD